MSTSLSVCDFVCFVLRFLLTHSCCFGVINDDDDNKEESFGMLVRDFLQAGCLSSRLAVNEKQLRLIR